MLQIVLYHNVSLGGHDFSIPFHFWARIEVEIVNYVESTISRMDILQILFLHCLAALAPFDSSGRFRSHQMSQRRATPCGRPCAPRGAWGWQELSASWYVLLCLTVKSILAQLNTCQTHKSWVRAQSAANQLDWLAAEARNMILALSLCCNFWSTSQRPFLARRLIFLFRNRIGYSV